MDHFEICFIHEENLDRFDNDTDTNDVPPAFPFKNLSNRSNKKRRNNSKDSDENHNNNNLRSNNNDNNNLGSHSHNPSDNYRSKSKRFIDSNSYSQMR